MEDHYKTLGLKRSATPEEVKKAYFEMAKKYHPDSGDESEVKKFHEVAEAYKVLSESDTKKAYDLTLEPLEKDVKKVETKPAFESFRTEKRASYRDDELKEYHQNRFKKAVFRVVGFSVLVGVLGYAAAVIIGGVGYFGGVAGLLIGFSLSINKNFKVESFFDSKNKQKIFRIFTWLLFLAGLGYFVWLIVMDFVWV